MADTDAPVVAEVPVVTIDSAVTAALEKEAPKEGEAAPAGDTPKDEKKNEKKEESKPDFGLTGEELIQAQQLFAALKSPEHAPAVIEYLAKQGGYEKVQTKEEVKEVKKDMVSVLKAALGPELDYLADKMGPAIEQMINEKLVENTKDIRATLQESAAAGLQKDAGAAMVAIAQSFFKVDELPDDVASEMTALMGRRPPAEGQSIKEYIEDTFYSVVGRKGLQPVNKKKEETINKNRNDAPSRLASEGVKQPVTGDVATKKMTLDEAVKAGMSAVQSQIKD